MDPATRLVRQSSSAAAAAVSVKSVMWCLDAEMAAAAVLVLLLWQPEGKDVSLQRMLRTCQLGQLWQASCNFIVLLRAS